MSYAWDYVVKDFANNLPDEGYLWIDFCAVSQHNNSHSKKEISSIGEVVKRIFNSRLLVDATLSVLNNSNSIRKLGHSLTRAWVLYEIVSTPKASLKIQLQITIENNMSVRSNGYQPQIISGEHWTRKLLGDIVTGDYLSWSGKTRTGELQVQR